MDKELIEKIAREFCDEIKVCKFCLVRAEAAFNSIRSAGYVKLAEDQTPPCYDKSQPRESDYNYKYIAFGDVVKDTQQDMLTPHKEGERMVKWVKVIV
jgi:hypothetical protein